MHCGQREREREREREGESARASERAGEDPSALFATTPRAKAVELSFGFVWSGSRQLWASVLVK